jgi:hypothetical protein
VRDVLGLHVVRTRPARLPPARFLAAERAPIDTWECLQSERMARALGLARGADARDEAESKDEAAVEALTFPRFRILIA